MRDDPRRNMHGREVNHACKVATTRLIGLDHAQHLLYSIALN